MQAARGASLSDADTQRPPSVGRRGRITLLVAVALTVYLLDVSSKVMAVERLADRPPVELLGGLLTLRLVRNPGAAFGLAGGLTVAFTLVAVGVILAIARIARRLRSLPWAVALGMLLGGALGNLTDRLLRAPGPLRGHVVDFLELPHWPVFNLADSAIVCGGLLMVLLAGRGIAVDGTHVHSRG
jgi:signal peptidase II